MTTKQQQWQQTSSDLIVPTGTVTDKSATDSEIYLHIKEKSLQLERLYTDAGIELPGTSDLASLIADAILFLRTIDNHIPFCELLHRIL